MPLSNLSKYQTDNFLELQHYRKSKRVLFSLAGAMSDQIGEVVLQQFPHVVDIIDCILAPRDLPKIQSGSTVGGAREQACLVVERSKRDYEKSNLRLTDFVSKDVLAIGAALQEAAGELTDSSPNAELDIRVLSLEGLLPYCGFYITHRAGQTNCPDIFWQYMNNVLFATTKCNYQELAMNHAFVRWSMPLRAYHDIYELQRGPKGDFLPGA